MSLESYRCKSSGGWFFVIEAYSGNEVITLKVPVPPIRLVKKMKIVTLPILWEQALPKQQSMFQIVMEQLHLKPDQNGMAK
jgi:hypothetical protein